MARSSSTKAKKTASSSRKKKTNSRPAGEQTQKLPEDKIDLLRAEVDRLLQVEKDRDTLLKQKSDLETQLETQKKTIEDQALYLSELVNTRTSELKMQNAEWLDAPDSGKTFISVPNTSTQRKHRFRIELSLHDETWQGKIEHIFTRNKKNFTGLDESVIHSFIQEHIGSPGSKEANPQSDSDGPPALTETQSTQPLPVAGGHQNKGLHRDRKGFSATVQIDELSFYINQVEDALTTIPSETPFMGRAIISLNASQEITGLAELKVGIQAEQLDGMASRIVCQHTKRVAYENKIIMHFPVKSLPPGFFQLRTFISLNLAASSTPPVQSVSQRQMYVT